MGTKSAVNAICISLLPLLLIMSGYFLLSGRYLYSLLALLGIVACMETRVRMGYRGRRGWLFAVHLGCGIFLILLLLLLILHNYVLLPLAYAAFLGMTATGIVLVKGSWDRLY